MKKLKVDDIKKIIKESGYKAVTPFTDRGLKKIRNYKRKLKRIEPSLDIEFVEMEGLYINDDMVIYHTEPTAQKNELIHIEFYPDESWTTRGVFGNHEKVYAKKGRSRSAAAGILKKGIEEGVIPETKKIKDYLETHAEYEEPSFIEHIFMGKK